MNELPILVLGMHRSGTSCLAGMLAAGGLASAGDAVRNWDNARGHFEMLDAVRLDEAVLAHSGGHWLAPPAELRWTDEHAALRDRILAMRIAGRPALIKDPRTLLVLPFWRASALPFHAIAIVRHPLAVARSLESWRSMAIDDGVQLWSAHNRALLDDRARHTYPLIDFDAPRDAMIAATLAAARTYAKHVDEVALAAAYEDQLVHHDGIADTERHTEEYSDEYRDAYDLHRRLVGTTTAQRRSYPHAWMKEFTDHLARQDINLAAAAARQALGEVDDAAVVLVPVTNALVRAGHASVARGLVIANASRLEPGMADLLHAKALAHDPDAAVRHLEAALAIEHPFHQARHMLPHALRAAGRNADARTALERVAGEALYAHGPLATLAEWSWLDGERTRAFDEMARAIAAAPPHRRGRLRTRRAEWLLAHDDVDAARTELEHAIEEDPGYPRSREVLARIHGK